MMKKDMELINSKLRAARKLPESNPTEYNFKKDILEHWEMERYKLKRSIEYDEEFLLRLSIEVLL